MVEVTYNAGQLLQMAFGLNGPAYKYSPADDKPANSGFPNLDIKQADSSERLSWMGTPIMFPITLKGGTYKVFDKDGNVVDYQIEDFEMPAATIVNFTQPKIIQRTQMPANMGTVKEFYSFDDWDVRIRGLCLDDDTRNRAKTAKEQKQELLKWNRICSAVNVVGELFFEKDINALSLGDVNFTTLERKPNVFPFEIACFSDHRFELAI
jgi:hypothetical protein